MHQVKRAYLIVLLLIGFLGYAQAQVKTVTIQPKGDYAKIETQKTIKIIQNLQSKSPNVRHKAVATLLKHPNDYAPPALFLLSNILFEQGKKPQAMFWFYTAQLRTRSDVNKAEDPSVDATAEQLSKKYGEDINAYARTHIDLLKRVVKKVVEWDGTQKRNYDPRWILQSGVKSYTDIKVEFKPKSEWPQIDKQTREDYYRAFHEALKQLHTNAKFREQNA